jgi:hypothetical protein
MLGAIAADSSNSMPALTHVNPATPADGVVVTPETWMRKAKRTRGAALLGVTNAAVWVAMFFIPGNPYWHKTTGDYLALGVFFFGVASLSLLYARRLARAGLRMAPDRVTIRGPLRTRSISLADAQRFVPGIQPGFGNGTPCPMLQRHDGRPVGIWALGREGVVFRYRQHQEELQPLCDRLNELLGSLQS